MNYYEHHIGDYAAATAHLSLIEDALFSRMLRRYYLQETPLPGDVAQVARLCGARSSEEVEAVGVVLGEFFHLEADGWHNKRADEEIARYQEKLVGSDAKRENEAERQRRHRERRKELFDALREHGIVPKYDTPTNELETHLSRVTGQLRHEPETRDATATHTPDTNLQEEQKQQHVQPPAAPCRFAEFWAAYPNKKGRQEAEKTWRKRKLDPLCDDLITHVSLMEKSDSDWLRGYVPMGSTYLNQARWEDVPKQQPRAGPALAPPSKTLSAIQTLQSMKSNGNVDSRRDSGRPEQAALLGAGTYSGR